MLLTLLALIAAPQPSTPDTTLRLPRGTAVAVVAAMQSTRLRSTAGDEVTVVNGTLRLRDGRLRVAPSGRGPLEVTVPAWAPTTVEAVAANIDVVGAPTDLEIQAAAGQITVTGGTGHLAVFAGGGDVTITGYQGTELSLEVVAGNVSITDADGPIRIDGVSGEIRFDRVRSTSVTASSTAGNITWSGAIPAAARYRLESHSGDIRVVTPPSLDARVRFRTVFGDFETALPARTTGVGPSNFPPGEAEREVVAIYGTGAATVEVKTFAGSLQVLPLGGT